MTATYLLEIQPLNLGDDVKALGLELLDMEDHEPVRGAAAAEIWSRVLPAIAGQEPWALDFFSHLDRLREFCRLHHISYREGAGNGVLIERPEPDEAAALFERFETETFGARAGGPLVTGDAELERDLRRRGVDAYHPVFPRYLFCAACDFESSSLTLLSNHLWASEVIRRLRPSVAALSVEVQLPA